MMITEDFQVIPPDDTLSPQSTPRLNDSISQVKSHTTARQSLSQPELLSFSSKPIGPSNESSTKKRTQTPSESSMDSNRSGGKLDWRKHYWEMSSGAAPKQDKHKRIAATFSAASAQSRFFSTLQHCFRDLSKSVPLSGRKMESGGMYFALFHATKICLNLNGLCWLLKFSRFFQNHNKNQIIVNNQTNCL